VAEGHLALDVEDDGVGIGGQELTSPGSLGLFGMRERARSIGAALHIGPCGARGTAVRLRVPVQATLEAGAR
jgi:signal transduction histidine kinase